ncbi:MAG: Ku protein, partial [Nocardioidaceae bacterium]
EDAAKPQELKMARLLVETLAGDYEPDEFEDDYQQALEALVEAKLEGGEVKAAPEEKKEAGEVVDLLAALQRSVDAAKSSRGEAPSEEEEERPAAKKTSPKKQPAKKGPAKKTAAKKSPAKKTAAKKRAS